MNKAGLQRVFRYNSIELEDPGPDHDPVDVRNLYSATYPEITSAAIEGPDEKDNKLVYTFRRAVGTKGGAVAPAMKEKDLRAAAVCHLCGKGFGHTGMPLFWRVTVTRYGVNAAAIRRQDGLAAHLGNTALAAVMGPDEDMATPICEPTTVTVCEACAIGRLTPVALLIPE